MIADATERIALRHMATVLKNKCQAHQVQLSKVTKQRTGSFAELRLRNILG